MKLRLLFCCLVLALFSFASQAQDAVPHTETTVVKSWFPHEQLFEPLLLDPWEYQPSLACGKIRNFGKDFPSKDLYFPFTIGFIKPLHRWDRGPGRMSHQLTLDLAVYTQFEWLGELGQRNILNTDYRGAIGWQFTNYRWSFRVRYFHQSSHTGNDHIIRRGSTNFAKHVTDYSNYEELDFMASRTVGKWRLYGGGAFGTRIDAIRKRPSVQAGFLFTQPIGFESHWSFIAGTNTRSAHQTDFYPNTKSGIGLQFDGGISTKFSILLEHYIGYLPFGLNELAAPVYTNPVPKYPAYDVGGKVQYMGIGIYMTAKANSPTMP